MALHAPACFPAADSVASSAAVSPTLSQAYGPMATGQHRLSLRPAPTQDMISFQHSARAAALPAADEAPTRVGRMRLRVDDGDGDSEIVTGGPTPLATTKAKARALAAVATPLAKSGSTKVGSGGMTPASAAEFQVGDSGLHLLVL